MAPDACRYSLGEIALVNCHVHVLQFELFSVHIGESGALIHRSVVPTAFGVLSAQFPVKVQFLFVRQVWIIPNNCRASTKARTKAGRWQLPLLPNHLLNVLLELKVSHVFVHAATHL